MLLTRPLSSGRPTQRFFFLKATLSHIITRNTAENNVRHDKRRREMTLFLPEHILQSIPKYKAELDKNAPTARDDGQPAQIADSSVHDEAGFLHAISLAGGNDLPPIKPAAANVPDVLKGLLRAHGVCAALELAALQDRIVAHVEYGPNLPAKKMLAFAKIVYDGDKSCDLAAFEAGSAMAKAVKRKLAFLVPELLQDGTVERIKGEGGVLGTVLLEVVIDHFAGKQAIKKE